MVLGQFPPRKTLPPDNCPFDGCPLENCPRGKLHPLRIIAPGQLLPRKIAPPTIQLSPHHKISPQKNCPHSSKFLSKSTTIKLRKTMHCFRKLSLKNHCSNVIFQGCNLVVKGDLLPYILRI